MQVQLHRIKVRGRDYLCLSSDEAMPCGVEHLESVIHALDLFSVKGCYHPGLFEDGIAPVWNRAGLHRWYAGWASLVTELEPFHWEIGSGATTDGRCTFSATCTGPTTCLASFRVARVDPFLSRASAAIT